MPAAVLRFPVPAPHASAAPRLAAEHAIGRLARLRRWEHEGAPTAPARPSAHPAVEIAWVDAGSLAYRVGTRLLEVPAGSIVLVPHGAEHTTAFGPSVRAGALWISTDMVDELADALGRPGRLLEAGRVDRSTEVLALTRVLSAELDGACAGHLLAAEALLEAIVIRALRDAPARTSPGPARSPGVRAAQEMIHARYGEALGVDDLARAAGMSRFHFSRLFRAEVGLSPYRYLMRVRVERAAELLRGGRHDVTQAALEVGFGDLGRFARAFRARFGRAPSQLLRRAAL